MLSFFYKSFYKIFFYLSNTRNLTSHLICEQIYEINIFHRYIDSKNSIFNIDWLET